MTRVETGGILRRVEADAIEWASTGRHVMVDEIWDEVIGEGPLVAAAVTIDLKIFMAVLPLCLVMIFIARAWPDVRARIRKATALP